MASVKERVCESDDNFDVKEHMNLGKEDSLKLNDGDMKEGWSLGHYCNHKCNYLKIYNLLIEETKYNPERATT